MRRCRADARQAVGQGAFHLYNPSETLKGLNGESPLRRKATGAARVFKKHVKNAMTYIVVGVLTLAVMVVAASAYIKALQGIMEQETYTYLEEISTQLSGNTQRAIETMDEKTLTLAAVVNQYHWEKDQGIAEWLDRMCETEGFSELFLIDETGAWITPHSRNQQMFMRDFSVDVGANGIVRMSPAQNIGGQDYLVLGVPLDVTTEEGTHFVGLVSAVTPDKIRDQLSLTAFGGVGYAHVVTADGRAVLKSDKATSDFSGYNLFEIMTAATFSDPNALERARDNMANGEVASLHYVHNGIDKFAMLTPVGIEDWYLFSVLPTDFVYEKSNLFVRLTAVACLAIGVMFVVLLASILAIQRRSKKRLEHAAFFDPITGGNTQLGFEAAARDAINHAGERYSIAYINIQGFKDLNEKLGRSGADEVLRQVYLAIESDLRHDECAGRIMADHYAVLFGAATAETAKARFDRWVEATAQRTMINPGVAGVHLSGGVYVIESAHMDVARMLDRANTARQQAPAQAQGAHSWCGVYDERLEDEMLHRKELEGRAETALKNGEFVMYLQPKYNVANNTIGGAEALVRWKHPVEGMIAPNRFIPLFEESGFIRTLDLYMFERACAWLQSLVDAGIQPVPVSVNLSRRCFDVENFLDAYEAIWKRYRFPANLLELEFTESVLYDQDETFAATVARIHEIGFTCSMDDFGAGYSSLNMLGRLDLDSVKLDRGFVANADADADEDRMKATIRASIALIKDLNMTVVAEGVEEPAQVDMLRSFGCDLVQGFVYARPMPETELMLRLKGERHETN